jgi:hypothetical protein
VPDTATQSREAATKEFKVTLVYANTGESVVDKVVGTMTGAELKAKAYELLQKSPQPGDIFEIHDEPVQDATTVAEYAEEFGKKKEELIFEITNPTGGA